MGGSFGLLYARDAYLSSYLFASCENSSLENNTPKSVLSENYAKYMVCFLKVDLVAINVKWIIRNIYYLFEEIRVRSEEVGELI